MQDVEKAATAVQVAVARACLERIVANAERISHDAQVLYATTANIAVRNGRERNDACKVVYERVGELAGAVT